MLNSARESIVNTEHNNYEVGILIKNVLLNSAKSPFGFITADSCVYDINAASGEELKKRFFNKVMVYSLRVAVAHSALSVAKVEGFKTTVSYTVAKECDGGNRTCELSLVSCVKFLNDFHDFYLQSILFNILNLLTYLLKLALHINDDSCDTRIVCL